ncbi:MAG: hypothetical protein V4655_00530 [Bdellovibrionota bacterium]
MNRLVIAALCSASLSIAPSLFAASPSQNLDLAGLKVKCNELQANEQLKPFKAVVSCKQTSTEWRPSQAEADPTQIANFKEVGASFTLKGYEVPFKSEAIEIPSSFVSCSILEQVRKSVPAVDIELSCEALNSVDSIADLCAPAIDARVDADPSIVFEELTGATYNSCSGKK